MPRYVKTIKFYGCKFRCGYSHNVYCAIENHEVWCWKDSRWRTCITCKFGKIENEENTRYRYCDSVKAADLYESLWEEIYSGSNENNCMPVINCPYWNNEYNGSCNPYIAEKNIHTKKYRADLDRFFVTNEELPF